MKKLRIYFDTSIINFLFADDAPEKRDITIEYFKKYVEPSIYEHYISDIVIDEINRTKNEDLKMKLLQPLSKCRSWIYLYSAISKSYGGF